MVEQVGEAGALWLGPPGRRAFAMVHRPAAPTERAVVVCNSLGFEGLVANRPLRHVTERLVDAGFLVIRLDYPDSGDSEGGEWHDGQVARALASIDDAVALAQAEGATDVRLLGFRIGATLAASYARTSPVTALALWAPSATGAGFARELSVLSRLADANRPAQRLVADRFPADSLEVVGFEYTGGTLRELKQLDLRHACGTKPAAAVLVLDRDDIAANDELVQALVDDGAKVDHGTFEGYVDLMTDDETTSVIPTAALDEIVAWLTTTPADIDLDPRPAPATTEELRVEVSRLSTLVEDLPEPRTVVERAVWIDGRHFTVVCEPSDRAAADAPVLVLLNTGSVNRSGPGRLHVLLARHLAARGVRVVRTDLGGAGDGRPEDPATENKPYAPVRTDETEAITRWVRHELRAEHISLFGICSGATNAFRATLREARVERIVMVNPLIFSDSVDIDISGSTDRAILSANMLSMGVGNAGRWRQVFRGEMTLHDGLRRAKELVSEGALDGLSVLLRARMRNLGERLGLRTKENGSLTADLAELAERNTHVLMVFAADEPGSRYVNVIGGRAVERLQATGALDLVELEGGDHVFSPPGSRQRLIEVLTTTLLAPREATETASPNQGRRRWTSN